MGNPYDKIGHSVPNHCLHLGVPLGHLIRGSYVCLCFQVPTFPPYHETVTLNAHMLANEIGRAESNLFRYYGIAKVI